MKLWIAREPEGMLNGFSSKPVWDRVYKCWQGREIINLYDSWFPEITFENSPQQVEIKLVKEE